jgi:thiamine-phosphate pyrophosphorylase
MLQNRFSHLDLAQQAIAGGADTIQLRHKGGSTRRMIDIACEIREICSAAGVCFIVNDRLDVAMASDADGVHLGQDDFPIPLARKILGEDRIIGGSAATPEEALRCQAEGADYLGFGPVFPTGSKAGAGPVSGIEVLRNVVRGLTLPVVAIGGIQNSNIADIMGTGAWGIAVISAVCCRESPEHATRELLRILQSGCS